MGLRVEHVNKSFAELHVISDLSMQVREGSIFGFLGPNGAGKTTTMRMILGRITWNGQDVSEVSRRNWGYLPEERGLYPKVKVEEQLFFLARLHRLSKIAARKHLDEWTQRFQITEYRNKKVEELSKGNQQKIQFLATIWSGWYEGHRSTSCSDYLLVRCLRLTRCWIACAMKLIARSRLGSFAQRWVDSSLLS
jgi:ABC-2 type transport system ATP-binding protein